MAKKITPVKEFDPHNEKNISYLERLLDEYKKQYAVFRYNVVKIKSPTQLKVWQEAKRLHLLHGYCHFMIHGMKLYGGSEMFMTFISYLNENGFTHFQYITDTVEIANNLCGDYTEFLSVVKNCFDTRIAYVENLIIKYKK